MGVGVDVGGPNCCELSNVTTCNVLLLKKP